MTKEQAIKYFGTASELAKSIGVTKQAVFHWKTIPDGRQAQIQIITNGALIADPINVKAA